MTPQYIVLTVTRVAIRNRNNPKLAQAQILNPPVRQLFVLPLMMSKSQHSDHVEIELEDRLLTMAEHFEDVVSAINFASTHMTAVARPTQRDAIAAAVQQGDYLKKLGAEMRAAEGAKHQGEVVAFDDPGKCEHGAAHGSFCPHCPDHVSSPMWSDFVQTDGENVGAPASERRTVKPGDLRIVKVDGDRYWVETCLKDYDDDTGGEVLEWARAGVPAELLPLYDTREAAQTAVKLAGYSRRLWEE